MNEWEMRQRIRDLERKVGLSTYTFYTYEEYYVDDDRTQYGVGGSNNSGWKRRILSKSTGLSSEEADRMARNCGTRYYQIEQE